MGTPSDDNVSLTMKDFPKRTSIVLKAICAILAMLMLFTGASSQQPAPSSLPASAPATAPSTAAMDAAMKWLRANPPDGNNALTRRQKMAVIQAAADALMPEDFYRYVEFWTADPAAAGRMEQDGALYYLTKADDEAVKDFRRTKVRKGLAIWYIYNMGYLFKTPSASFAIDLAHRRAPELAKDLDFLLVTHPHGDHYSDALIQALIDAKKPVVTSWVKGSTIVPTWSPEASTQPAQLTTMPSQEFRFGAVRVRVNVGDHHFPAEQNNMLMYQVDCGEDANFATIYHSGDNNSLYKMQPDRPVSVFMLHVSVGMSVEKAIKHLKPRMTLVSHVLELGHSPKPPQAWRWSFDYAFGTIKNLPESAATVLTWGERWLTPGTDLQE